MLKVTPAEAKRFMYECLKSVGTNDTPAMQQAQLLLYADSSGHQTHGLNRLEHYINDIKHQVCQPNNSPKVLQETLSTAWVDACNGLGAPASHYCVDLAMKKAKQTGVGWVSLKGSNHNGMIAYWVRMCADKGFIGLAFTNTSPLLAPTRSKKAALGSNPLAIAAPAGDETFCIEMATTAVALGTIEIKRRAGQPIPLGWALGPDGKETTDAELAAKTAMLMPLGGGETTSGYKGYGLSAAVELFCGICAGSNYGHHIRHWGKDTKAPANLGQCFIAVNTGCFAPGFKERLQDCLNYWRTLPRVDAERPVLAPGDVEKKALEDTKRRNGILYMKQQIGASEELAKKLKVKPIVTTPYSKDKDERDSQGG